MKTLLLIIHEMRNMTSFADLSLPTKVLVVASVSVSLIATIIIILS